MKNTIQLILFISFLSCVLSLRAEHNYVRGANKDDTQPRPTRQHDYETNHHTQNHLKFTDGHSNPTNSTEDLDTTQIPMEQHHICESEVVINSSNLTLHEQNGEDEEFEYHQKVSIPDMPEGFVRVPLRNIRTDKTIMTSYGNSIPVFLLTGIGEHEKFKKSNDTEEREEILERGFLLPTHYLLKLVYIFRKEVDKGYIYSFGVLVNICAQKQCKGGIFTCDFPASFSVFEPSSGLKSERTFLEFLVDMPEPGLYAVS